MASKKLPVDPSAEAAPEDYLVARLALWAGDADEAEKRLSVYRGGSVTKGWSHLLNKSALRTKRQLKRRQSEYKAIYAAAAMTASATTEHILRSKGGHLGAVVWVENERDYELRIYVLDLAWEEDFYRIAKSTAKNRGGMATKVGSAPLYGQKVAAGHSQSSALGVEWALRGTMLLQVAVSDFDTATVRGTWIEAQLPGQLDEIISPFQELINEWDPLSPRPN